MNPESRREAGVLLILLPTVIFGGASLLTLLIRDPAYMQNPLRQDLWRAGHAHAGVLLVLSLIVLRYVDEAQLSSSLKRLVRGFVPLSAILVPAAFFLSMLSPTATAPNALINLAYLGGVVLATGLLVLGVGLVRTGRDRRQSTDRHPGAGTRADCAMGLFDRLLLFKPPERMDPDFGRLLYMHIDVPGGRVALPA